jgi:hypothetical protein
MALELRFIEPPYRRIFPGRGLASRDDLRRRGRTLARSTIRTPPQPTWRQAANTGSAPDAVDRSWRTLLIVGRFWSDILLDGPDRRQHRIHWKKAQACEELSLARLLRRDGLAQLTTRRAGTARSTLLYNPPPFPVHWALRVPGPAVVELDREQLPGADRHFVPTQRFIRLKGETRGVARPPSHGARQRSTDLRSEPGRRSAPRCPAPVRVSIFRSSA